MKREKLIILIIVPIWLAACREQEAGSTPPAVPAATIVVNDAAVSATVAAPAEMPPEAAPTILPTATAPPTATPVPPKSMTVCMAQPPPSLYLYSAPTLATIGVHHAIYENLYTRLGYAYQAQGLDKLPDVADGDVRVQTVTVNLGDPIIDFRGDRHALRPGLTVINSAGELEFVADRPVEMMQMSVDFLLQPMVWSDGTAVTAADSVFSFEVAAAPDTQTSKRAVRRTASYEATGERTLRWTGLPGYLDPNYVTNVWTPLPRHQLADLSPAELAVAPETTAVPLSSGPFIVANSSEEEITLSRNPHYYRADAGLPFLDEVRIRFVGEEPVLSDSDFGGCDVLTQDLITFQELPELTELPAQIFVQETDVYEHVDFSVNFYLAEGFQNFVRPDWFQDTRVRQAIAQCTDRQRMVEEIFFGESRVLPAYIPAEHPLFPDGLTEWPHDVAAANRLLDAAGYLDGDGDGVREDPETAAPFRVRLTTDSANPVRAQAAAIFQENLAACGIDVTTELLPPEDWYSDGPLGPLFGRRFELGMFAWISGAAPACHLWLERNITGPVPEGFGGWGNVNVTGWADPGFEAACGAALASLPGTAAYTTGHQDALRIWTQEVPTIPLFSYLKVAVARPGVSGLHLDPTQLSELWNLVEWDVDRDS